MKVVRKTKILATIGPASDNKKILRKMINAGTDAVRINTSHADPKQYSKVIKRVRSIKDIPIVFDTQGPEIRLCCKEKYAVKTKEIINAGFDDSHKFYFNTNFYNQIKKGQIILIDEGVLRLKVISKTNNVLELKAMSNGIIIKRARVNIPSLKLNLDILTESDKENIEYANKNKIDYIALSYTSNAKDVETIRKLTNIGIIAKIENAMGVKNFDEILKASDGIMIARGDLGVEIESEKLPLIQKEIIRKCNQAGKLVITATQMLQSMVTNSTPTRAETSDVANAILDGTDVVMLAEETAIGKYPVLAIKEMCLIARENEKSVKSNVVIDFSASVSQAISKSVYQICQILPITKIITLTRSGYTARIISRFRLKNDIIAITPNDYVRKKISLYYGVNPIVFAELPTRERIIKCANMLFKKKLINSKDLVLITAGVFAKKSGSTNLIEVHRAKELMSK